jgi:AmiR/NasT family two-component response regulator
VKGARIPSFRNMHALVVHPDDNDRRLLEARLRRLGLAVHCLDEAPPAVVASQADVIFFDVDTGIDGQFEGLSPGVKLVALVGAETPGRLEWMLAQEPGAWLMKPIRSSGIYTALAVAFHRFKQQQDVGRYVERLRFRARGRDPVDAAVAQIMQRNGCSEDMAFGILRKQAMDSRLSLIALSESLLAGTAATEQQALGWKEGS